MSAEGFRARARPEPPSAQILVVVANTLERSWRTDAEKGFLSTAVAQVLVDPKPRAKALQRGPPTRRRDATSPWVGRGRGAPNEALARRGPPLPSTPLLGASAPLRGAARPGALLAPAHQTRRRCYPERPSPLCVGAAPERTRRTTSGPNKKIAEKNPN